VGRWWGRVGDGGGGLPALGAEDIAGGEGCWDEEAMGGLLEGYWEVVRLGGGGVWEGWMGWGAYTAGASAERLVVAA